MGPAPTRVAFSVVETTDPDAMLQRAHEFLPEMLAAKVDLKVDLIFVAIVDITALESHVVISGAASGGFDAPSTSESLSDHLRQTTHSRRTRPCKKER